MIKLIANENAENFTNDKSYNGNQIKLDKSVIAKGNIWANCSSITSKGYIIAEKDIAFNTSITESNNSKGIVIASEKGNITFNGSTVNLKGIIYAPKGTVTINAANFTLQGRIIADKIIFRGSNLNVQAGEEDLKLIDSEQYYPSIKINTSEFKVLDEQQATFLVDQKVNKITGTSSYVLSMNIRITSGRLEIANKAITPSENWSVDIPGLIVGKNMITVTATGLLGKTTSQTIVLVNQNEENSDGLVLDTGDDDNDFLLNWQEDVYCTDKKKADTDGDGLTDYQEIFITLTDPLKVDTDGNGINDGDEDFDNDKLNNKQECQYNADPYKADTDGDGLTDYEEVFITLTDPAKADTDGNGINDGDEDFDNDKLINKLECQYQTDSFKADTDGDALTDYEEVFITLTDPTKAEAAIPSRRPSPMLPAMR